MGEVALQCLATRNYQCSAGKGGEKHLLILLAKYWIKQKSVIEKHIEILIKQKKITSRDSTNW